MTQNTNTTPSSPAPEDESVTDYLLRKISGKKGPTSPTVKPKTSTSLSKEKVTPEPKPSTASSGITLIDLMIGITVIAAVLVFGMIIFTAVTS